MPKPYPQEFRDDVVRVARDRGEGVTIEQVAKDFGVHPMTLHKWMRRADIDEGRSPGVSATESAELREARKRIQSPHSTCDRSSVRGSYSTTCRAGAYGSWTWTPPTSNAAPS